MFARYTLILALLAYSEAQLLVISPELKALLPKEMVEFADSLSSKEREVVKSVNDKNGTATYIKDLKTKDEELAKKAAERIEAFQKKFNRISGPGQKFIESVIYEVDGKENVDETELKKIAASLTEKWDILPADVKKEIRKTFSHIARTLESKKFRRYAA
ncbi:unnamed protein product [Bursaphelenchus xylophilus]|uniref:(pine wood nematode) hypothetical protein n=1 Tax=Bursaphelenchus xylophilus TaxID=6326 RepID=A0A1I7RMP0_BURXY|nr:unnamed protein product [Bursaphelenchus xylophilus]CAG9125626.1 unnamed protein product [Bursaphelenchus xylophilus]